MQWDAEDSAEDKISALTFDRHGFERQLKSI